jgi:hypothetical protein
LPPAGEAAAEIFMRSSKADNCATVPRLISSFWGGRFGRFSRFIFPRLRAYALALLFMAGFFLLLCACGRLPAVPAAWEPQNYKAISYQQLLGGSQPPLQKGEKIQVAAYFWQFLTYEPAMVRNYLTLARHPLSWYKLEWCALYETSDMRGYYDRVAMDPEQRRAFNLSRMEHVLVFGEMAPLGAGSLYLRVHRIDRIASD